jgi:hypothetical protein
MTLTARRLPGFRFEPQPAPARDVLPRMDVAVFVGFAASGPLHVPVVIEDPATYTAIFGADLPLAWDRQRGTQVYAYLGPAVRAFFRCGGQRCYVIRVAGAAAKANVFALPGIASAAVHFDASGTAIVDAIAPAHALARSEGSWSDGLRVSTALLSRGVDVVAVDETRAIVQNATVVPGDLLRLTYRDMGLTRLVVVGAVEATETGGSGSPPSPRRSALRATIRYSLWLAELAASSPPLAISSASIYGRSASGITLDVLDSMSETLEGQAVLLLKVPLALADAPPAGSMIIVDLGAESLLLAVHEVRGAPDSGSPVQEAIWITCKGVRWLKSVPAPTGLPLGERLTFELRASQPTGDSFSLPNLAFALEHPRAWYRPGDDQSVDPRGDDLRGLPTDQQWYAALDAHDTVPALWQEAAEPRFPLAGGPQSGAFTFPFALSVLPEYERLPYPNALDALARDGLNAYGTALFLDEDLAGTTALDLAGRADYLRYLSPDARPLKGIHAAMAIEEATLIAVPDALHPGWEYEENPAELDAEPLPPLPEPDWSQFLNCGYRILPDLVLTASKPDAAGTFTLSWDWEADEPGDAMRVTYTLEESVRPNFADAKILYSGPAQTYTIYGRMRGDYFYHVRAAAAGNISNWSNGVGVRVAPGSQWALREPNVEADRACLTIHRALMRLCAARADIVAVLAMPEHFREDAALEHAQALTPFSTRLNPDDLFDLPLTFAEDRALTYAALYHPWLHTRDGETLRPLPPDGALCGMIARRTLERGAWIAPANEPIPGVLALVPPLEDSRLLELLQAQINIIKPSPSGFVAQAADTLSLDEDLRPLNVRRLLILLRRLVLRQGVQYVFEPFDDVFRRMVQRSMESVLESMYARGAFAGRTSTSAFQVIPRSTPQDVDQGRFIVDLRVAPSLPMEFLTVRLVQSGDRSIVSEER